MLTPLTIDNLGIARALLEEGFPERGAPFWARGIEQLAQWQGNAETGFPFGFFWVEGGRPVGIVLTPATTRAGPDGARQTIVNVSSWFIQPAFRWKAPLMLRALFRRQGVVFTDLTPSPEVRKMLPAFGFQPVNPGILLLATPWRAMFPARGWTARAWNPQETVAGQAPDSALVSWHVARGCHSLVIEKEQDRFLVLTRPFCYRGMAAAETLYVGSHAALREAMPALSRYLLRHGIFVLQTDVREVDTQPFGFRPRGIWFARGACFADHTDHLGSELCLLDL